MLWFNLVAESFYWHGHSVFTFFFSDFALMWYIDCKRFGSVSTWWMFLCHVSTVAQNGQTGLNWTLNSWHLSSMWDAASLCTLVTAPSVPFSRYSLTVLARIGSDLDADLASLLGNILLVCHNLPSKSPTVHLQIILHNPGMKDSRASLLFQGSHFAELCRSEDVSHQMRYWSRVSV